jgi:hypothetical protein
MRTLYMHCLYFQFDIRDVSLERIINMWKKLDYFLSGHESSRTGPESACNASKPGRSLHH